jgi:hypothetical protein
MKKLIICTLAGFLLLMFVEACSNNNSNTKNIDTAKADSMSKDSLKACGPIMDPNNPKPMALMMRLMAANADSMRSQILRGEALDSANYPFIKFYLVEPTDPNVLEPQFFENARLFQTAYKDLFEHPKEQKKYYNLMINSCVKCHESYCSGPLKRINKFPIQ